MGAGNKKFSWKNIHPNCKPTTRVLSAGYDPAFSEMSAKTPIFPTSTFLFKSAEHGERFFHLMSHPEERGEDEDPGLIYSRMNNPNMEIVEDKMLVMEPGAEDAVVLPSGMSAISTMCLALLKPGDIIIYSAPVYGGTEHLFEMILPKFGIETKPIYSPEISEYRDNLDKYKEKIAMIFIETPTNPTIVHTDIEEIIGLAGKYSSGENKIKVAVDNTFMGPVFQNPIPLGADLVVYSATKFIGGHSDLIGGFVLGKKDDIWQIKSYRSVLGATTDPFCCWMISRSLETIDLRMRKCAENATKIAAFLADHPKIEKVVYPTVLNKESSQYQIYEKQCKGPGALISFYIRGGKREAFSLLDNVEICKLAVSLGGTETLIQHPRRMTHAELSDDMCKRVGLTDSMVRLSVGVEDPDDIIEDLKKALEKVR
ncbi:MAG: aminotransferase class I/II-fold pyridoxal phosphate-dependent enzyme [Candidatus Zixiibacteriota bacterium]|nr:MAG: aminotransferase class I/II-fold pyridoxal phosphate-dependent enzyme [candidate division Zixibacteria bacterium]